MREQESASPATDFGGGSARVIRYFTAFVLLFYGFAKLNGSQFTILDSELDKPLGQVGGFWLTWYYFGFSPFYGSFIAVAQIAGALLLTFKRTTLLGACLLAGILTNIILIDVSFRIDPGATALAVILMWAVTWLIWTRRQELLAVFWPPAPAATGRPYLTKAWLVRFAMLALAFAFTYWIANYNNRSPTPLDGAWDVVQVTPQSLQPTLPKTIFFERNRAFMCVFKSHGGLYATHDFEVDPNKSQLRIWEEWLRKGDLLFQGTYALSRSDLTVQGLLTGTGQVQMHLHRR